ncbi:MAG: hypothetical protein ABJC89_02785 [Acidobacteriota bacterium]
MMRRVVLLIAFLIAAPSLRATVLVPAEFREIVAGSQIIVYGRIAEVRPEWSDDRRRIDSIVTVDVASYLKGGPGGIVTFRVPGGQIGRYKNVMIGAPEFQAGEEAVLFLTAAGTAPAHVFGLSQGVYRVRLDARTGRRMVIEPVLTSVGLPAEAVIRGAATRRPLPLETFAASVRAAMAGGR